MRNCKYIHQTDTKKNRNTANNSWQKWTNLQHVAKEDT